LSSQYNLGGVLTGTTVPATKGTFPIVYNPSTDAAVAPGPLQSGLGGNTVSGAATTYTVNFGNNLQVVNHDVAGSAAVTVTLPTPTTLENTNFGFSYENDSAQTDTITPTTWTINGASSFSVPSKTTVRIKVDPFNATNWLAASSGGAPSGSAGTEVVGSYPSSLLLNRSLTVGAGAPFVFGSTGVFTSALQNESFDSIVNGGGTCSIATITTASGTSFTTTNGITGAVCDPAGSTGVTNGFSIGVAGLFQGNNTGNTGQFGYVGGVGVLGQGYAAVNNSRVWGANFAAIDKSGNTGNVLSGVETDVAVNNNSSTGFGYLASFRGNGQPTADNFPAFLIQPPAGTGKFTSGFECQNGSIAAQQTYPCLYIGQQSAGTSKNSMYAFWQAQDGSGIIQQSQGLNQDHVYFLSGFPNIAFSGTDDEGFGIALTSTAALARYQLVKIDTAHADSVVVCTTADTSCDGFVAGLSGASTVCGAASTVCGIIAAPGMKVRGLLGTGTCAIGDYVIVDTTTNGRIKCTGSLPTLGNVIGRALSAQSSVGSTVDILTKFE
jgi:hypothetical protein